MLVCPVAYLKNHMAELHQFYMLLKTVSDSVVFWRQCNMLCTSSFVDDVLLAQYGEAYRREIGRVLKVTRQRAAPAAKPDVDTTASFAKVIVLPG